MVKCGLVVTELQVTAAGGDRDLRGPRLRRLKGQCPAKTVVEKAALGSEISWSTNTDSERFFTSAQNDR